MQLTSFCNSWILAVSSLMVSSDFRSIFFSKIHRFVTLELSSILPSHEDLWYELHRFCSDGSSDWSRLDCSHPVIAWSISIRWESIIPFNSWILLPSDSAWISCFWISDLTSARICSLRILIRSFSRSRLDFRFFDKSELGSYTGLPYLYVWKEDWVGNKLSSREWKACLRFAGSSRSWVNSGEDSAFPISSSSSSASHEYDGSVSMPTDSFWKIFAKVSEKSKLSSCLGSKKSRRLLAMRS